MNWFKSGDLLDGAFAVGMSWLSGVGASHGDDDLSSSVAFLQVPESFRDFSQGVTSVDDGCHAASFDELLHERHVFLLEWSPPPHDTHLLASCHRDQRSQDRSLEQWTCRASLQHIDPLGVQRTPAIENRTTGHEIEDPVIALPALGEVLPGVIDDVVCADRAQHVQFARAVDAGHFRPEGLGDLHGEGTNVPTCTVDQDLVSWLDLSFAAKTLQGQDCRLRYGRCLFEGHPGRLQRKGRRRSTDILGKCTEAMLGQVPEHLVAWPKVRHALADRLDLACYVYSQTTVPRRAQPGTDARDQRPSV